MTQVSETNANSKLGWFLNAGDIGAVKDQGSFAFDAQMQSYTVPESGKTMWFADDQFQFVWRKMSGDSMQVPNWTKDGKALIFNRNGKHVAFVRNSQLFESDNMPSLPIACLGHVD